MASIIVVASSWMHASDLGPGRHVFRVPPHTMRAFGWGLPTAQKVDAQKRPEQSEIRKYNRHTLLAGHKR